MRDKAIAATDRRAGMRVPEMRSRLGIDSDLYLPHGEQVEEQRYPSQLRAAETRVAKDGKTFVRLEGYASVTDRAYEMWDLFGPYDEVVARGAFDDTLARDPDVHFLLNHKGLTMARTTTGTLELRADDTGLHSTALLNPNRADVSDLLSAINDGLVDEMSFAFRIDQADWNDDMTRFTIRAVDLHRGDVSAVNHGASPHTSIAARTPTILAELRELPRWAQREARKVLDLDDDPAGQMPQPAPTPTAPPRAQQMTGRTLVSLDAWIACAEADRERLTGR